MKGISLVAAGLLLACIGVAVAGCKKKPSGPDAAYYRTPEGTHHKIQELRLQLTEAMEKKNLQYIHDSMYYFKDLCTALSAKLEGEQKQRIDAVLADLTVIAEEIDNSAGRGNQAATEANLQKLIGRLQELENEFKQAKQ